MPSIPLALQLYSVREDAARDLPAVLKAVREMGYDGVEFAGWYGYDAAAMKTLWTTTDCVSPGRMSGSIR